MTVIKNQQVKNLQVTDGLEVAVIQHQTYEFLIPTKDVALGYGISAGTVRDHQTDNPTEFIYGKHYIKGADIPHTLKKSLSNIQPHAIFWTKQGIIRLGFFIKSERAKVFRDWAESVILNISVPAVQLPQVSKPKHNRLTSERMLDILVDIAQIEDKALRLSLISKLGI
ncbi:hypothetical protein [Flavobacterium covae]|uniref:hypothetical protein n=1 Tax=Flavobacterium covae TaxID=2906076 RepID=UPI0035E454A0